MFFHTGEKPVRETREHLTTGRQFTPSCRAMNANSRAGIDTRKVSSVSNDEKTHCTNYASLIREHVMLRYLIESG